jgi:hypothetical protein
MFVISAVKIFILKTGKEAYNNGNNNNNNNNNVKVQYSQRRN